MVRFVARLEACSEPGGDGRRKGREKKKGWEIAKKGGDAGSHE